MSASPQELDDLMHACLKAGDIEGISTCLHILALTEPSRAQWWLDVLGAGLGIANAAPSAQPTISTSPGAVPPPADRVTPGLVAAALTTPAEGSTSAEGGAPDRSPAHGASPSEPGGAR